MHKQHNNEEAALAAMEADYESQLDAQEPILVIMREKVADARQVAMKTREEKSAAEANDEKALETLKKAVYELETAEMHAELDAQDALDREPVSIPECDFGEEKWTQQEVDTDVTEAWRELVSVACSKASTLDMTTRHLRLVEIEEEYFWGTEYYWKDNEWCSDDVIGYQEMSPTQRKEVEEMAEEAAMKAKFESDRRQEILSQVVEGLNEEKEYLTSIVDARSAGKCYPRTHAERELAWNMEEEHLDTYSGRVAGLTRAMLFRAITVINMREELRRLPVAIDASELTEIAELMGQTVEQIAEQVAAEIDEYEKWKEARNAKMVEALTTLLDEILD